MAYSNPGWVNGQSPFINATNLNNISNTLAKVPIENGGTNATTASAALTNLGAVPKANVTSKGSANTPVFFTSAGVASPITSPLPISLGGTGQTSGDGIRSAFRLVRYPQTTTTVGSATNPVWINDGLAASCDYTLAGNVYKTVPSNAVFTDTTNLSSMTGTLPVSKGGTGQTTVADVRSYMRLVRYPDSTTTVGSATNPVWINDGLTASCTYSLNKTVPADAVFTDTTNLSSMTGTLAITKGGTGATTKAAARENLEAMGMTNGYETSNLNNCTDRGFYTYNSGASNTPTNSSGSLLVLQTSSTYIYQLAFPNVSGSGASGAIWARLHNDAGWMAWQRVL